MKKKSALIINGHYFCHYNYVFGGYGHIYPVTILGKIASILITFLGRGTVAVPIGILSARFTEYMLEQNRGQKKGRKKK